jgi:NADPH-dependent ferric siderophore reductase
MPPTLFLIFFSFCAGWAANSADRVHRGDEVYIAGQRASRPVTAAACVIILAAVAIMVAIAAGFMPDHAP